MNMECWKSLAEPIMPYLNSWEFWTTSPMSRSKKRMRTTRIRRRMTIAPSGSEKMLSGPKKKMAPSGPPCSQQLPAQTKVHSKKEKYEADIKKMTSAARLALVSLIGKYLRVATRTILGSYHPSNILPSHAPDYSMRFSAGPANSAMDPFARRKLRGSILARASVVSSRETSAARERGEERKQNSHGETENTEQSEETHCR